jgi:chemotaxis protein histidine kinase CheA/ActR/RegA family two-component response regulator
MTIDDLLALLAAEYEQGLAEAKSPLDELVSQTQSHGRGRENASEGDCALFIAKSIAAADLVGLAGVSMFLSHAQDALMAIDADEYASADRAHHRIALARWCLDALDVAKVAIDAPTAPEIVELVLMHASQSPLQPHTAWLDDLSVALMQTPQLPMDEDDVAQHTFNPVGPEDVSLRVDAADPDLLASMLHDAPGQLDRLYRDLVSHAAGASRPGALVEAQRVAHTLKGSGNIIGIAGVARLAHRLEDTLVWLDSEAGHVADSRACATRDAILACETLQQMVAYLAGEDAAPAHALPALERMQDWAQLIHAGEAETFSPPEVSVAAAATNVGSSEPVSPVALPQAIDAAAIRIGSEQVAKFVKRAGQSLANVQRTTQSVREIDERLRIAQDRQRALHAKLDELQRTVDRQVVALQEQRDESGEFDPLELDRYDTLHVLSRLVAEAVQDQVEITNEVRAGTSRLITDLREEQRELRQQHKELLEARLISFASLAPRLRRNVAQTSAALGKNVKLEIIGEATTVDADVLSRLTEPLLHLLRNAVDHGIESPAEREDSGKPLDATIRLSCAREGQFVRIELSDDGRGLDERAIVAKAVAAGLFAADSVLDSADIHRLILQKGFSTKLDVSDVSGRGIGLDIVNDRVKAMKGQLAISSQSGVHTTFVMRVPVTSGIATSIIAQCASERVAISSDQVQTVFPPESVHSTATSIEYRGTVIPIVSLAKWLGFSDDATVDASRSTLIVADASDGSVAIAVDRVIEVRELVLQDVGGLLRQISGIQTGALGDTGTPLFVVDVKSLELRARSGVSMSAALALRQRAAVNRTRVLVVDDALSARRAVQHAFEDQGFEVHVASDGFEALEVLRSQPISLVATDLEMPNLNGLELTRRMREVPAWASIPIIMITSRGGERHRQTAQSAGVDVYLTKPFSDADLLANAKHLLQAERAAA